MEQKAVYAGLVAFAVAAVVTPLVARLARRIGAVDNVKERGLARDATPLLGGLAIFAGAFVAGMLFLPDNERTRGVLEAAALITAVGAADEIFDLNPPLKVLGPIVAGRLLGNAGGRGTTFTFPFPRPGEPRAP